MKRSGLNPKTDGLNLLKDIRLLPDMVKVTFAAFVGKPFLNTKLAIHIWKRLSNIIETKAVVNSNDDSETHLNEFQIKPQISTNATVLEEDSDQTMCSFFTHSHFLHRIDKTLTKYKGIESGNSEKLNFFKKLFKTLKERDFVLPKLALIKWMRKWPMTIPTQIELQNLRLRFPKLIVGKFNEEEEFYVLKQLDALLLALDISTSIEGKTLFIERLLSVREPCLVRFKLLVGAYVGGKKLLKYRIAIDVWNRLKVLISNKNKVNISKNSVLQAVENTKKKNGKVPYDKIRETLGISKIHNNKFRSKIKERTPDEKSTVKGRFELSECKTLVYCVFKKLNINNINQYKKDYMPIGWKEISKEFFNGRRPDLLRRKWFRLGSILMFYEDNAYIPDNYDEIRLKIIDAVFEKKEWTKFSDVDKTRVEKMVKYWEVNQIDQFFVRLSKSYPGIPLRDALGKARDKIESRIENPNKRPPSRVNNNTAKEIIEYYKSNIRNKMF